MREKTLSLRDKILSAPPAFRRRMVDVPEWDAKFEVRSLSVAAKLGLGKLTDDDSDPADVMTHLLVCCVFDPETGEQVFTADDGGWIRGQDSAIVETLAESVLEVSGLKAKPLDSPKDDSSKIPSTGTSSSEPSV